ncbi:hypothetical protein T02_9396 [Trichinella nativa]|uniref:Uncharacterized protein n=1 Tax=Trichinella nativa TaxID=6335 RepID=A0A0V1LFJ1_9BILA|nr:hypothetical protein T02_9396 [Trichinella nativa]KRZ86446.1 hypothetical protein T08_7540 [Trichinella sp. T8]
MVTALMSKADVQVKIARRRSSYGIFGLSEALIASNRTLSSGSLTHWRTISALIITTNDMDRKVFCPPPATLGM